MLHFNSKSDSSQASHKARDNQNNPKTKTFFSHVEIDGVGESKESIIEGLSEQVDKYKQELRKANAGIARLNQDRMVLKAQRDKEIQEARDFRFAAEEEFKLLQSQLQSSQLETHGMWGTSSHEQTLEKQLCEANEQIVLLEKALDDCKDKIFGMQPEQHVSDSSISDQYVNLCECIGDWVDTQFEDIDGCIAAIRPENLSQGNIALINRVLPVGAPRVARLYKDVASHIVEMLVHAILMELVFQTDARFPGLHEMYEKFLDTLEDGMKKIETNKGKRASFLGRKADIKQTEVTSECGLQSAIKLSCRVTSMQVSGPNTVEESRKRLQVSSRR